MIREPYQPRRTYRVAGNVVAAAGTFPFLVIAGAAGRVLRVSRIKIHGPTAAAIALLRVAVQKLSAAPTGGTGTAQTKVPLDSQAPASLATITAYTAAPTAGTVIGQISERTVLVQSSTPAAGAPLDEGDFDWTGAPDQTEFPTLRGTAERLAVVFPVAPAGAITLSFMVEYMEDGN